jgi:hypothetical protein
MSERRIAKESFNVAAYKALNGDVAAAFGDDYKMYYYHYINCGYSEGRTAVSDSVYDGVDYSAVYNKDYYMANNGDVAAIFGDDSQKLIKHFVECGLAEGRRASQTFDVNVYKDSYEDLRNAFGDDLKLYYLHYINFGLSEGRKGI